MNEKSLPTFDARDFLNRWTSGRDYNSSKMTRSIMRHLIKRAQEGRVVTYSELFKKYDLPPRGSYPAKVIATHLYRILNWCRFHKIPLLTVIVVRKSGKGAGLPGPGFWKGLEAPLTHPITNAVLGFPNSPYLYSSVSADYVLHEDDRELVIKELTEDVFNHWTLN